MKLDSLTMILTLACVLVFLIAFLVVESCSTIVMSDQCKETCGSAMNVLVTDKNVCVCKSDK